MIRSLLSDSVESNAFLVVSDKVCVIDPGIDHARVLNHKVEYSIGMDVLINTHCHFDHVGANPRVLESGSVSALCHGLDAIALESGDDSLQLASLFGSPAVKHKVDRMLSDGDIVDLGGASLEVIHTPGHTRGSICLYEPESKSLFSGDTVFSDGVGRTDCKGGSIYELEESLKKLMQLSEERGIEKLYPGHGQIGTGDDIKKVYKMFF
ncbi:MAG: MBL fold metallo-hydrolase [Candidatus Altiarchaeota archaeon]